MKVRDLLKNDNFRLISEGNLDAEISKIYCCDLMSIVMSKAPAGCAWVTVMSNVNAVAVALLAEMSCIILAEGSSDDELMLKKAQSHKFNILKTSLPVFDAALIAHEGL